MKPHLDIQHEGTLGDERTRMEFDPDSAAHLMSILTDLYSDPAMAVIREYSTNALDSHVAASQTRPIEVELPSSLRPMFVVRDFGIGMTVDQIINQFSKYGWSSKRDSDTAVGMLGLGCKSGLSYTSQFTMVSVHDGVQVTVLVTREEDGAGAVQIIDTVTTDKANGVEVQVPVSRPYEFEQKAKHFFRFWEKDQVLVNGAEPDDYTDEDTIHLADDIDLVKSALGGGKLVINEDIIVMGNVAYPVKGQRLVKERDPQSRTVFAVMRVPIGAVNFTPSREALHMTKRTIEVLDQLQGRISKGIRELAQVDIDAAPNAGAAVPIAFKWLPVVPPTMTLTYKGQEVPHTIYPRLPVVIPYREGDPVQVYQVEMQPNRTFQWERGYGEKSNKVTALRIQDALKVLHVVGFKGNGVQETTKRKVLKYLRDNKLALEGDRYARVKVLFYGPEFGSPWLDNVRKVQFADIQDIDLGDPKPAKRSTMKYRAVNANGDLYELKEIPAEQVAWFSSSDGYRRSAVGAGCSTLGVTVLSVPLRSVNKFIREHPTVPHIKEWLADEMKVRMATLTAVDLWRQVNAYEYRRYLGRLESHRVVDPALASLVRKLQSADGKRGEAYSAICNLSLEIGLPYPKAVSTSAITVEVNAMCRKYPLLAWEHRYSISTPEVTEIVNALYLARKFELTRCDSQHPEIGLHPSLVH